MEVNGSQENTLRDFLRVVFRYKIMILTTMIIIFFVVAINMELQMPVSKASVKMLVVAVKDADTEYYKGLGSRSGGAIAKTQVEIVKSRPVIERVVKALKLDQRPLDYEKQYAPRLRALLIERSVKEFDRQMEGMTEEQKHAMLFESAVQKLTGSVSAVSLIDTDIFQINVTDVDPVMAARLANAVSRSYLIYDLEQQIAELVLKYGHNFPLVLQLQEYIGELYDTLDGRTLPHVIAIGPATVKIMEQAQRGVLGNPPGILSNIPKTAASFLGLFLGVFLAFVFDFLDQTFKSPQDIKKFLKLPLLGSLPKIKSQKKLLISNEDLSASNYSRSYQNLSNNLFLLMKERGLKSILITDVEGSDEPAIIIANLAVYSANKAGYNVLIIDANLRSPSISKIFNISAGPGLINVLENNISFEAAVQDLGSGLHVLTAGENAHNPATILNSSSMHDLIKRASGQYDLIFINCADLKNFTDVIILSPNADGLVLIINEGKVRRQVVSAAIENLQQNKVNIVGVIFNNQTFVIPEIIYKLS